MNKKKSDKIIYFLICLIISLYFISSFYFVFKTDEEVSMGLIQQKLSKIIPIDSLDVHPPFYYLFLKLFLTLTTFWTKSIFVKVIFARLASVVFLILFLISFIKLLKSINVQINIKYQILIFLLAPGVINESAKIRMYSLSAFLLIFELYQLTLFVKEHKVIDLILAVTSASLASYTFYPLAISAGVFILLFFLWEILDKHIKSSLLLFASGICMALLYLPWMSTVLNQFINHSNSDSSLVNNYFYTVVNTITQLNVQSPTSPLLKYMSIISIIIIILFIFLIIYSFFHSSNLFNVILIIVLINFVLTLFISVFICKRQFRLTILYPIYTIFIYLLISILINHIYCLSNYHIIKYFIAFAGMIFVLYSMVACVNNVKTYDIPSIQLVKNYCQWKNSKKRNININNDASIKILKNKNIQGNSTYVTQDSEYLRFLNKNAIIYAPNKIKYKEFISRLSNDKNNYEFFHKLFPNLRYKNNI